MLLAGGRSADVICGEMLSAPPGRLTSMESACLPFAGRHMHAHAAVPGSRSYRQRPALRLHRCVRPAALLSAQDASHSRLAAPSAAPAHASLCRRCPPLNADTTSRLGGARPHKPWRPLATVTTIHPLRRRSRRNSRLQLPAAKQLLRRPRLAAQSWGQTGCALCRGQASRPAWRRRWARGTALR